jgi:hypothetical protein
MTVTTDKTTDNDAGNTAEVALSANDYLLGRGEREPDLSKYTLPWSLGIDAHVYQRTPLMVRVYDDENRVTLRVGGGYCADLHLYLAADQIDRLIVLLTAARQRLR